MSNIGLNLVPPKDYTPEPLPFINIAKAGEWITNVNGGQYNTQELDKVNRDANGYPISMTPLVTANFNRILFTILTDVDHTVGTLIFEFDGDSSGMTIGLGGSNYTVINPNKWQINAADNTPIEIRITAINEASPLTNFRIYKQEYEQLLLDGEIFDPRYIELISKFTCFRFMDWLATNDSEISTSAEMVGESYSTYYYQVPIEICAKLLLKTNKDGWFCYPHLLTASTTEITLLTTRIVTILDSDSSYKGKLYFENSNETWNSDFTQSIYYQNQAVANGKPKFNGAHEMHGRSTATLGNTIKPLIDPKPYTAYIVLGNQAANFTTYTRGIIGYQEINAGEYPDMCAIAPYFTYNIRTEDVVLINEYVAKGEKGFQELFSEFYKNEADTRSANLITLEERARNIQTYIDQTTLDGVALIGYEGGQHLVANGSVTNNSTVVDYLIELQYRPEMEKLILDYYGIWEDLTKNSLLCWYNGPINTYGKFGSWALLEQYNQVNPVLTDTSYKWIAILKLLGIYEKEIDPTMATKTLSNYASRYYTSFETLTSNDAYTDEWLVPSKTSVIEVDIDIAGATGNITFEVQKYTDGVWFPIGDQIIVGNGKHIKTYLDSPMCWERIRLNLVTGYSGTVRVNFTFG